MRQDQRGYIVVETIGSFLLFTLLIVSILTMINIVTVQARVHAALTQACETVSMYSYVLDLTGAASHIQNNSAKAGKVQGQVDQFRSNVNGLLDGVKNLDADQIGAKGEATLNQMQSGVDYAVGHPKEMLQYMMNYGLDKAGGAAFEQMVRPLVGRYLANGGQSGDAYLRSYGVADGLLGLHFYSPDLQGNDSQLLTSQGNVKIVVQYDVDYHFGALVLPFDQPKLHVTQEVMTKAWLGGEGEGYRE